MAAEAQRAMLARLTTLVAEVEKAKLYRFHRGKGGESRGGGGGGGAEAARRDTPNPMPHGRDPAGRGRRRLRAERAGDTSSARPPKRHGALGLLLLLLQLGGAALAAGAELSASSPASELVERGKLGRCPKQGEVVVPLAALQAGGCSCGHDEVDGPTGLADLGALEDSSLYEPFARMAYAEELLPGLAEELCVVQAQSNSTVVLLTSTSLGYHLQPLVDSYNSANKYFTVVIDSVPTADLYSTVMAELSSRTPFYDGFVYPAGMLPQIAAPDAAQDVAGPERETWRGLYNLEGFMRASQNVDWAGIDEFVRRMASADEKILGLPLYYDIDLLFYRKDVLDRFGFKPPATFEELIAQITEMEGTDFNGDGVEDFPICVQLAPNCWAARKDPEYGELPYVALFMSIIAPMTQGKGTNAGTFWDPSSKQLALNSPAMLRAARYYQKLHAATPEELWVNNGEPGACYTALAKLWAEGRCAFGRQPGGFLVDLFNDNSTFHAPTVEAVKMPGSKEILYWSNPGGGPGVQELMPCTPEACWYASPSGNGDGPLINRAPYDAAPGYTASISAYSTQAEATYDFISWLAEDRQVAELALNAVEYPPPGYEYSEWFHTPAQPSARRVAGEELREVVGLDSARYAEYLAVLEEALGNENVALNLNRIPVFRQNNFTGGLGEFLVEISAPGRNMSEVEVQDALDELQGKWQSVVDRAMNDTTFGDATRASFGLYDDKPKEMLITEDALTIPQIIGVIFGASAVAALGASLAIYVWRKSRQSRRLRGPPPPASPDTTYAMTDIEDSTKLWEALSPSVMSKVMKLHDKCLSDATKECFGYLSFTEGDAFFVAFHSVNDAVKWALLVQERLLELPWPPELLAHPSGREESSLNLSLTGEAVETGPGAAPTALFRGLRVRIGIHRSGDEAGATSQEKNSSKIVYSGFAPSLTRVVCDAGAGGAITITGSSFRELETIESAAPFHCGEYRFDVRSAAGETVQEQVVLLTPPALLERVDHFPRTLKEGTQLSEHCLDAPRGDIALCFVYVSGKDGLLAWDREAAEAALEEITHVFQLRLAEHDGYAVESMPGFFFGSFWTKEDAVLESLMGVDWSDELIDLPGCEEMTIMSDDSSVGAGPRALDGGETDLLSGRSVEGGMETVFRGPRVKIGIYSGDAKGRIHPATGRMSYTGRLTNRTGRIASSAAPGQILASHEVVKAFGVMSSREASESFKAHTHDVRVVRLGKAQLKGVREGILLYQVANELLSKRPFPRHRALRPSPKSSAAGMSSAGMSTLSRGGAASFFRRAAPHYRGTESPTDGPSGPGPAPE